MGFLVQKNAKQAIIGKLFKQIIENWTDLRAYAYVMAFVPILKRKISSLIKKMKKIYSVEPIKRAEPAFTKALT